MQYVEMNCADLDSSSCVWLVSRDDGHEDRGAKASLSGAAITIGRQVVAW